MNILVKSAKTGRFICRPDTSWERENNDFYVSEAIDSLFWSPILFTRIVKAGKGVGDKFAGRYHESFGFGLLLYVGNFLPDMAAASCADHTSVIPFPLYNDIVLETPENEFTLEADSRVIYRRLTGDAVEGMSAKLALDKALCQCTSLTSVRIGDILAVELQEPRLLEKTEGQTVTKINANFCDNSIFDFNIIY